MRHLNSTHSFVKKIFMSILMTLSYPGLKAQTLTGLMPGNRVCPGSSVTYVISSDAPSQNYVVKVTKGTINGRSEDCVAKNNYFTIVWDSSIDEDGKIELFASGNTCQKPDNPVLTFNMQRYKYPTIGADGPQTLTCGVTKIVEAKFYINLGFDDFNKENWDVVWPGCISLPTGWRFISIESKDTNPIAGTKIREYTVKAEADGSHVGDIRIRVRACQPSFYSEWSNPATFSSNSPLSRVTPGPITFCSDVPANTATVSSPVATSYTWTAPAGFLINGASSPVTTTSSSVSISTSTPLGGILSVVANTRCGLSNAVTWSLNYGAPSIAPELFGSIEPIRGKINVYGDGIPGATSYKWYLNGVYKRTTSTSATGFNVGENVCGMGFVVSVEAANNCGVSPKSSISLISDPCEEIARVLIYPNPATSELLISSDESIGQTTELKKFKSAILLNQSGEVVKESYSKDNGASIKIETSDLAEGTYFLHIKNGSKLLKKQVIIRH